MRRFLMILAAMLMVASLGFAQVPGSVVITEVMYDDTASTDVEWAELHNTTGAAINLSDWVLIDDSVYPADGGEGGIIIPVGTMIGAGQYLVVSRDATGIPGAVQCVQFISAWTLGNSGDNLALYSAQTGGVLIDGALTAFFPDLAGTNLGNSIEKCDPNAAWTSDPAAWHESTNEYATSGRYRHCTPGFANSACADNTPPTIASCLAVSPYQVDVLFSESLEETTAETESFYLVTPGALVPDTAKRDESNFALVHLIFNTPFANNNYVVSANGVEDMFGNASENAECTFIVNISVEPCDVVITEIMYDDTASTDAEWVEIYNRTTLPIDISGWVLSDDNVYPGDGGEGVIAVPSGTILSGHQYAILCRVDLPVITGEIICTPVIGSWTLGNSGDNVALFTAASGGQLVDGSLSENFPDLAFGNGGNSIEKCDQSSCWSADAAAWTECVVSYATVGQYRHCTPNMTPGFCCPDPVVASVVLEVAGPPTWTYRLNAESGCISKVVFTSFCAGTFGSVTGEAASQGWYVLAGGDGNDSDSIIFVVNTPFNSAHSDSVIGFQLTHPTCAAVVNWEVGGNSGTVDGPLPVEFGTFSAVAGNGDVTLSWNTVSEEDMDKFEIRRDGEVIANVTANNNASGSNYSYTDHSVENDVTYSYELTGVSLNGDREVLATASATPSTENTVVTEFALHQNYPNPFNPETSIRFDLAEASVVTLTIYNVAGQEVASLVNGSMNAGSHTVHFDGANLTSGVYLCRLTAGEFTSTMKMMLLK
jgi:hypothetical protein